MGRELMRECDERALRELERASGVPAWVLVREMLRREARRYGTTWRALVCAGLQAPDVPDATDRPQAGLPGGKAGHSGG
jgi:hypothetical protein